MPFKSRMQEKWAFATHQKFAKDWARITPKKGLPERVRKTKKKYSKRAMKRLGLKSI